MTMNWYNTKMFMLNKNCRPRIPKNNKEGCSAGNLDDLLRKYDIANQGMQTLAVQMFIETSGECAIMYFNWEARCV